MKNQSWSFYIVICLSLGLAPWFPEPHIWGKLKWLAGGGEGMGFMDWFDVFLHGTPWLLLLWKAYYEFVGKKKEN